jgi:hypothetical protein
MEGEDDTSGMPEDGGSTPEADTEEETPAAEPESTDEAPAA